MGLFRSMFGGRSGSDASIHSNDRTPSLRPLPESLGTSSSSNISVELPPNENGLHRLVNPKFADIDVVFVHGLTGKPIDTFTKNKICWPMTLLPQDLPRARVFTFGYDADCYRPLANVGVNMVEGHAQNLMHELAGRRKATNTSSRPIVFMVHSLGGIIVKDMLRWARDTPKEDGVSEVFYNTKSLFFLGTPHRGSDWEAVARPFATLLQHVGRTNVNRAILDVLSPKSEVSARINQGFRLMLRDRREPEVVCFYEELAPPGLKHVIVTKDSATLEDRTKLSLHRDHMQMTKFDSRDDPEYEKLILQLRLSIDRVIRNPPALADAICRGDAESVRRLAPAYNLDNDVVCQQMNAVGWAAHQGQATILKILVQDFGAHPDKPDQDPTYHQRPLFRAAKGGSEGHLACTRFLLECRQEGEHLVEIDYQEASGKQTALAVAASHNVIESVRVLLAHKADPTCLDYKGRTALSRARKANNVEVIRMLEALKPNYSHAKCMEGYPQRKGRGVEPISTGLKQAVNQLRRRTTER